MEQGMSTRTTSQKRYLFYGLMLIVLLYAIACVKHLARLNLWHTLIFAGMEDIALIVAIRVLWRYRSPHREVEVRRLADIALVIVLLIGVISEVAMSMVNR